MKSTTLTARRAKTLLGVAMLAATVATIGAVGTASAAAAAPTAAAAQASQDHTATASSNTVLVKTVVNAHGVLKVFKESTPHRAVSNTVVRPNDSGGCAGNDPNVCFDIYGGGLYVSYMRNTTTFGGSGYVDMQINGPSGVLADTGWWFEGGGSYYFDWKPYGYVAAGYYCGTSFIGSAREGACETVHN